MKKSTDPLLNDLFGEASLGRSMASFGKGRIRRRASRGALAGLPLLVLAAWFALPGREMTPPELASQPPPPNSETPGEHYVPGTSVRIIGDEELLRLLQGQPVALVNTRRGKQAILFDRTEATR